MNWKRFIKNGRAEKLVQVRFPNSPSKILTIYQRKKIGFKQYGYWLTVEWWDQDNYHDSIIPLGSQQLPEKFHDMAASELAEWINKNIPAEKHGRNNVEPEEAAALLDAVKRKGSFY